MNRPSGVARVLVLLRSAALSSTALADNWVEISASSDKTVRQYVDVDSIERNLGSVEMHRLLDYPAKQAREVNGKHFRSQRSHLEFDCAARSMRRHEVVWHAAAMGKGESLKVEVDTDWQIDSFDDFTLPLWKVACEGLNILRR